MNGKASLETLNSLHDRMATYFMGLLDSGEQLNPGEISSILKFLKDNEITADVLESKPMANLIQSFLENEEEYMGVDH
jgi:hypothetical protein